MLPRDDGIWLPCHLRGYAEPGARFRGDDAQVAPRHGGRNAPCDAARYHALARWDTCAEARTVAGESRFMNRGGKTQLAEAL
jgi:hypothetical protein